MCVLCVSCICLLSVDNYVHRLVQNKDDGKLVEVPGHGADTVGGAGAMETPVVACTCVCSVFRREDGLTAVGVHLPHDCSAGVAAVVL